MYASRTGSARGLRPTAASRDNLLILGTQLAPPIGKTCSITLPRDSRKFFVSLKQWHFEKFGLARNGNGFVQSCNAVSAMSLRRQGAP